MSFFDTHKHSLFKNTTDDDYDLVDFIVPVNPVDLLTIKPEDGAQSQSGGAKLVSKDQQETAVKRNKEFVKACKSQHLNSAVTQSCYKIAGFNFDM